MEKKFWIHILPIEMGPLRIRKEILQKERLRNSKRVDAR